MSCKLNIVLMQPEIPHNTGAIGRLCVGLNCRLHLVRPLGFALTAAQLRRTGMDYWEHLRLTVHDNWDQFMADEQPDHVWLASTHGTRNLYDCRFEADAYLIFGSESRGLPAELHIRHAESIFRIPMPGPHARSLNLANATAVVMYEAYRQINFR